MRCPWSKKVTIVETVKNLLPDFDDTACIYRSWVKHFMLMRDQFALDAGAIKILFSIKLKERCLRDSYVRTSRIVVGRGQYHQKTLRLATLSTKAFVITKETFIYKNYSTSTKRSTCSIVNQKHKNKKFFASSRVYDAVSRRLRWRVLAPTLTHFSTHDYRSSRIHAPDVYRRTASKIANLPIGTTERN